MPNVALTHTISSYRDSTENGGLGSILFLIDADRTECIIACQWKYMFGYCLPFPNESSQREPGALLGKAPGKFFRRLEANPSNV